MQDLSANAKNKDIDAEIILDGFELYIEMNADLKKICEFIFSSTKNSPNILLKSNSHIYKEIINKIDDYCIKYDESLDNYFNQINSYRINNPKNHKTQCQKIITERQLHKNPSVSYADSSPGRGAGANLDIVSTSLKSTDRQPLSCSD